jgi:hypothetical protein
MLATCTTDPSAEEVAAAGAAGVAAPGSPAWDGAIRMSGAASFFLHETSAAAAASARNQAGFSKSHHIPYARHGFREPFKASESAKVIDAQRYPPLASRS